MALAAETKAVVAHFDYTDEDVNKGVKEFLKQMGKHAIEPLGNVNNVSNIAIGEGLEKDGTSLSQIPTYVTAVPNGTEKVSS
jgi:hexokinase